MRVQTRQAESPQPRPGAAIVIVGSGHAGYSAAEAIRREDANREIVIFTADDGRNYYKPSLSNALARGHTPTALARESATDVEHRLGVRVHTECRVHAIECDERAIQTDRGLQPYDRLVLALGATPIRLSFDGDGADDVLSVNGLADYERFRERLREGGRVALIGNGLIGCEFANDLAASGHPVDLIGLTGWPMDRLLPETAGRRLQSALAELGVNWRLERTVMRVDHDSDGYRLTLSDDQVINTDVVLSAVGLRPRTELAATAGLDVGAGIRVDGALRTSDPAIHAIGDCIEFAGMPLPFIAPITHGVRALAAAVLGTNTQAVYPPMPVTVKTPAHPVVVLTPPPGVSGAWQVQEDSGGVRALFETDDGCLAGFVITGRLIRERRQWVQRCETDGRHDRVRMA